LLLLFGGLGCLGVAVVEAARNARSNQQVADRAIEGYSSFAAWSYQEHLTETFQLIAREVLGAVDHGDSRHLNPHVPTPGSLIQYLPWSYRCLCHRPRFGPMPEAFFGFTLGADTLSAWYNQWLDTSVPAPKFGESEVLASVRVPPGPEQGELLGILTKAVRGPHSSWGYRILTHRARDSTNLIVAALMPTVWGDTVVYAARYSAAIIDSILGAVLDNEGLLPAALVSGHRNRDVLSVQVTDAGGHQLFASAVPNQWRLAATSQMAVPYGDLRLTVQIRPELTGRLIIGGLPRSRLPLLLGLLAVAGGLTVVAMLQFRREARFARDRSAFVANVSHELRTPLAQIRLATDTLRLRRETDPERQAAALAMVDREVSRLQQLVDGVLRFTRGQRPGDHLVAAPVDVAAETRRVVEEFAPLAAARKVAFRVEAETAPPINLQAGALRQILLNLLDNAVKYGPDGQTIWVRVRPRPDGGVRLEVQDQGPGVAPRERDRIWRAFERGSAAAARAAGGSGIGLTVVWEIVTRHGGAATVNGNGAGAEFVVEFPGATT
jgi:signal transduction histidine kinase